MAVWGKRYQLAVVAVVVIVVVVVVVVVVAAVVVLVTVVLVVRGRRRVTLTLLRASYDYHLQTTALSPALTQRKCGILLAAIVRWR